MSYWGLMYDSKGSNRCSGYELESSDSRAILRVPGVYLNVTSDAYVTNHVADSWWRYFLLFIELLFPEVLIEYT